MQGHLTRRCVWHGVSAFSKKERSAGLTIRGPSPRFEEDLLFFAFLSFGDERGRSGRDAKKEGESYGL